MTECLSSLSVKSPNDARQAPQTQCTWKHFKLTVPVKKYTGMVKIASFRWNRSCVLIETSNRQKCIVKVRETVLWNLSQGLKMLLGTNTKVENEKSMWCIRQAGQWSNGGRIVWWRLWQKLWTKIFFCWHKLKIYGLLNPIMCPSWRQQWVFFFSELTSKVKFSLF